MTYDIETLKLLSGRVEKAEGPDRELDHMLHHALVGPIGDVIRHHETKKFIMADVIAAEITTSIDAALALVEKVLPGWFWLLRAPADDCDEPGRFFANLQSPDFDAIAHETPDGWRTEMLAGVDGYSYGDTAPLAVLSALLKALIAQEEAA